VVVVVVVVDDVEVLVDDGGASMYSASLLWITRISCCAMKASTRFSIYPSSHSQSINS